MRRRLFNLAAALSLLVCLRALSLRVREINHLDLWESVRFDLTVPAGASEMIYQVQAVRSTAVGPVANFIISVGVPAAHPLPAQMAGPLQQLAA